MGYFDKVPLKMLGLYHYTLTKLPLQNELQNVVTNNVFLDKK